MSSLLEEVFVERSIRYCSFCVQHSHRLSTASWRSKVRLARWRTCSFNGYLAQIDGVVDRGTCGAPLKVPVQVHKSFELSQASTSTVDSPTIFASPRRGNSMSGARITVDGLWRCLCPSIDSAALATAISVPYRPRRVGRLRAATTTCAGPRAAPAKRHVHTTPRRLQKDGSAAEKADPFAVLSNAETKATQDTPTSNSTDFDDEEPAVKVDEEYTKAWRGYFDVVFAKANDTVKRQETTLPTSKNIGEQSSSTVVNRGAKKDGIDELFGPTKEKQHKLLNIFNDDFASTFVGEDTGRDLSKWAPDEDAGEYPFDAVTDAGNEKEHNLPRSNNPGQGSPSMIAAMDAEQAPSEVVPFSEEGQQAKRPAPDDFAGSTGFMPKNEETTKTQSVDGVDQTPRARMKGDHEMVDRLVHMRPPFTHVPPEAKRDDILAALTQLRMRGPRSSRRITATLLKHLLSMDLKPQAFHYDLLFRAHCSLDGSADVIANLLQEMRHERVHWSANAYHSVLRVCAQLACFISSF